MRVLLCLPLLAAITGCIGNPDGGPSIPAIPFPSGGNGGVSRGGDIRLPRVPETVIPPVFRAQAVKVQEQHGAADADSCYQMQARFKKEGRDVKLVEIAANPYNKGGGALEFMCIFEGPDAVKGGETYEDYRYNSRDEYNL